MRDPVEVKVYKPDPARKPTLEAVTSVELKQGPKVRRTATIFGIRDVKRGGLHHEVLKIESFERHGDRWGAPIEKKSVSMEPDEINKLSDFLDARRGGALPSDRGSFVLLPAESQAARVVHEVQNLDLKGKADALAILLRHAAEKPDVLKSLVERIAEDEGHLQNAAAAINLAIYKRALAELEALIDSPQAKEIDFQRLLTRHPWMFGSEYSALLDQRRWTRDEQLDFVPRRTADGYIELVEIKTPQNGRHLFSADSRGYLHAGSPLSQVIGQAQVYLEKLDRARDQIFADDGEDTAKMRAKIIIGRDNGAHQVQALRRHNGHLHRIEVMTFDGLLATARRVVRCLEEPLSQPKPPPNRRDDLDDDMPF